MTDHRITIDTEDGVAWIRLDRPEVLNALDDRTLEDLLDATRAADDDRSVGAIVIEGGERAFAAGVDVGTMASASAADLYRDDTFSRWQRLASVRTPIIAAVRGYALGGGCELAMIADLIIAGDSARFGQPEITLGVIPGMGGTQRLVRAVGKAVAMDVVLSGRLLTAQEALAAGLVARVVPDSRVAETTREIADKIAAMPAIARAMAKEAVNAAFETTLSAGLLLERRMFHSLFATPDQAEGMAAFIEKRPPAFSG